MPPGSDVTLKKGTVSIRTKIIDAKGNGHFVGKIIGFDDWDNYEFEGLKPDDLVSFSEDKIVACL